MRNGCQNWCRTAVMAAPMGTCGALPAEVLVSTLDELTNAVAQASKSVANSPLRDIVLKPGVYDLSTLGTVAVTNSGSSLLSWGTSVAPDAQGISHFVFNVKVTLRGENTKHWSQKTHEEESVLKGNGTMRLLYPYTGAGRSSTFAHLSFEDGSSSVKGGALYVMNTEDAARVTLTNCVFRNCSAASDGGATCNLSAHGCLYENNTAQRGGGAYGCCGSANTPPTNVFTTCVFRGNTASSVGGGLYCDQVFKISGCVFSNNVAQAGTGGAINTMRPDATGRIEDCIFEKNTATGNGGAVYSDRLFGGLIGCAFTNNIGQVGGGFDAEAGVGVVSNCVFVQNQATAGSGGGGYAKTSVNQLVDSVFIGNTARYSGGAFVASNIGIGELARCTFLTNSATGDAGAVSIGAAQGQISDCLFSGNSSSASRGALYVGGRLTTLTNCTFVGNLADYNYASVNSVSYDRIVDCTFKDNVARHFYAGVAVDSLANAGTVEQCFFDNNTNAFVNEGSQIHFAKQVTGCTFRGYGDMLAFSYDRCVFDGCAFDYDSYSGGMIRFNTTTGPGYVRNCLFTNSTAHVYIKNDTGKIVEISNCTFVDNDAIRVRNMGITTSVTMSDGYLFYAFRGGSDPENSGKSLPSTNLVVNCVFANNKQCGIRNDVSFYTTATSVATPAGNILRNSLYEQVKEDGYFKNVVKIGLVVGVPKFVAGDPGYPDVPYYMLRRGSPARNQGILLDWMTADAVDLAGHSRVVDGLPDMGCYECDLPITGTLLMFR